jgi:hypothetical protein
MVTLDQVDLEAAEMVQVIRMQMLVQTVSEEAVVAVAKTVSLVEPVEMVLWLLKGSFNNG